jgi:hypothetical protein
MKNFINNNSSTIWLVVLLAYPFSTISSSFLATFLAGMAIGFIGQELDKFRIYIDSMK